MARFFKRRLSTALFLMLLASGCAAFGASPFKLDKMGDSVATASGALLLTTDIILQKTAMRTSWDPAVLDKNSVNAFDRGLIFPYSKPWDRTGLFLEAASLAFPLFLAFGPRDQMLPLAVMYAETLLFSYSLKELLKNLVPRQRPYMYNGQRPSGAEKEHLRSFPSGHAALSFSGASFLTFAFCKINPDSPWKWPLGLGTFALAGLCGASRIASGMHFLTDVLAGAAIGTLAGILVPYFHLKQDAKKDKAQAISFALLPNAVAFEVKI